MAEENNNTSFKGFYSPRSTQVPDNFFDEVMPVLSGAEVKVLLYVFRRTFGFKKDLDNISLHQMVDGIVRKDGTVVDRGTGLSKASVVRAANKLVERGMLTKQRRRSSTRGDEATAYAPKLTFEQPRAAVNPVSKKETRGGVSKIDKPLSKNETHNTNGNHSTTTVNVNGPKTTSKSALRLLPDLKQPTVQTQLIAQEILQAYGDKHSERYYQLIAAKIHYPVIQKAISEIKTDGGATAPAKVFTKRMESYADKQLQHSASP